MCLGACAIIRSKLLLLYLAQFVLILYIPVNNFGVLSWPFIGRASTNQKIKCLAQGHNTVSPVSPEAAHPHDQVYFSTTDTSKTLDKSAYQKINFLVSHPKHMLWVLKRTVSMRQFF